MPEDDDKPKETGDLENPTPSPAPKPADPPQDTPDLVKDQEKANLEPAPDPKPDDSADKKDDLKAQPEGEPTYPTFEGNPAMQAVMGVFQEKNVPVAVAEGIFAKAVESGDVNDVDVESLRARVGDAYTALIMNTVTQTYEAGQAAAKAVQQEAFTLFGNEAGWTKAVEWAKAKASTDPAFAAKYTEYGTMLNEGGERATLALKAMKEFYMDDPNTVVIPNLEKGDGTAVPGDGPPITSRVQYVIDLKKARAEGNEVEMARITRARAAGRAIENRFNPGFME